MYFYVAPLFPVFRFIPHEQVMLYDKEVRLLIAHGEKHEATITRLDESLWEARPDSNTAQGPTVGDRVHQ